MPNWCENRLKSSIPLTQYISVAEDGERYLDFNKIIPMPESLNITSGGSVETAMALINNDEKYFEEELQCPRSKDKGLKTIKDVMDFHRKRLSPKDFAEGAAAIDNIKLYGHKDWYDWSLDNWGTKWNAAACSISDDDKDITFDTAWSPPQGIFEKLCKLHPDAELTLDYYEGGCCYAGTYESNSGDFRLWDKDPESEEGKAFIKEVFGIEEEDESESEETNKESEEVNEQ